MYKENQVPLQVTLKVGDKIKLKSHLKEFDGKLATIIEQIKDYTYNVDISDMPFNESMFENGILIRN